MAERPILREVFMKNTKTVWAMNAKGFEHCGNCFLAKVLDDSTMHRPARKGFVWLQQMSTPKAPVVGDAWVSEWQIKADCYLTGQYVLGL